MDLSGSIHIRSYGHVSRSSLSGFWNLWDICRDDYVYDKQQVSQNLRETMDRFIRSTASSTEHVMPARIQDLTMKFHDGSEMAMYAQLWIIKRCPDLIRLKWCPRILYPQNDPVHLLAKAIRSGHQWSRLTSLTLRQTITIEDFVTLMEGIEQLTVLEVPDIPSFNSE
jgi:hypothetical protein